MTNEELAARAKDGDDAAMLELWEQVNRFIAARAYAAFYSMKNSGLSCGVEQDDLKQIGYIALVDAVNHYDPDEGGKFITYLAACLSRKFVREGVGTQKRARDPLNRAASLDKPLGDDMDGSTLSDLVADPTDDIADATERIGRSQIYATLNKELTALAEEQQQALQLIYYENHRPAQAARLMGISKGAVETLEHTAILTLRRRLRGLLA